MDPEREMAFFGGCIEQGAWMRGEEDCTILLDEEARGSGLSSTPRQTSEGAWIRRIQYHSFDHISVYSLVCVLIVEGEGQVEPLLSLARASLGEAILLIRAPRERREREMAASLSRAPLLEDPVPQHRRRLYG